MALTAAQILYYYYGGGGPALTSATVADSADGELVLVFNRPVTVTSGFSIVTDAATGITIDSIAGSGTNTLTLSLSRSIVKTETLYLAYSPGDLSAGGSDFSAFVKSITNNVVLMFNGYSEYGSFGDILDSLFAANDTYFELEVRLTKIGTGARRLIPKGTLSNAGGFHFFLDGSHNPVFAYNTDASSRRTISGTTAVANGDTLTLKYDGSLDTGDGLNRVSFEINGSPIGKTLSFTTGTLPAAIPDVAQYLGFADILTSAGVNNGVAMYQGNLFDLVVRSVGDVEINIPDAVTGQDVSGNNRDMTRLSRVPAWTTYTTRATRNISTQIGYGTGTDFQGRPRIVDRDGIWVMALIEGDQHTSDGSQKLSMSFSDNRGMPWMPLNTFTDGSAISFFPADDGETIADVNLILCPNNDLVMIGHKRSATSPFGWITLVQSRSTNGGKTWSAWQDIGSQFEGDDDKKWACYDWTTDGTNVWIALSVHEGDLNTSAKSMLYVSTDNCATFTKVSDISAFVDITWEAGIEWLGGTTILTVIRTSALNGSGARVRISTDSGANWSNLSNISIASGTKGLHQPRVKKFDNEARVYVSGRIWDSASAQRNGFLYSDNSGTSWTTVEDTNIATTDDGGYADLMKREDNMYVMTAYSGEIDVDGFLREYVIIGT